MFLKDTVLPKHINDFKINKDAAIKIQKLFNNESISNLYIYGPSGCGKYSLFIKNLESMVGKELVIFPKTIAISNQWASIKETTILSSEYHFEINLSKYSNNRNTLFSIIDTITDSGEVNSELPFKLVLIRNIHTTSLEFIKFIKQKSEQSSDYIRFILIGKTNSINSSILNGSFFCLRMSSPTTEAIKQAIIPITKKKIKEDALIIIINESLNNLSSIFTKIDMFMLTNFYRTRLDTTCEKICKLLLDKKFASLYEIREVLYDYQTHNEDIPALLKRILYYLLNTNILSHDKTLKLIEIIARIDLNQQLSYKEIIHLEHGMFSIFKLIHSK
jgi:hypothetical protein